MAIVITKKGKQINSHKVDVVCDECECEFTCDNTDFENGIIECPNCKNRDQSKMNVARRTCGYIGTQFWNQGRTQEIKERVLHL